MAAATTGTKKRVVRRSATKKAEPTPDQDKQDATSEFVDLIIETIENHTLDSFLPRLDEAITLRIASHEAEKNGSASTKKTTASVRQEKLPAPKRGATPATTVKPVADKVYKVSTKLKTPAIGGASVKFRRYFKGDEKKSVVVMQESRDGYPKGKTVTIPTAALQPAASRRVARKSA